jgi:hypothetical protein
VFCDPPGANPPAATTKINFQRMVFIGPVVAPLAAVVQNAAGRTLTVEVWNFSGVLRLELEASFPAAAR